MTFEELTLETLPEDKDLMWSTGGRRKAYSCPIFSVNEVDRTCHDGRQGRFIEIACPEWIIIIPIYKGADGRLRVVMERQYRHGSDSITVEYPAGLVEKGEDPLDAAKRELLEETGLKAGRVTKLASLCPNPAFMSNHQHIYLAENLESVADQDLDANEEIEVFSLPFDEAVSLMGSGKVDNSLMVAATGLAVWELNRRNA